MSEHPARHGQSRPAPSGPVRTSAVPASPVPASPARAGAVQARAVRSWSWLTGRRLLLWIGIWAAVTVCNSGMTYASYLGVGKNIWWLLWSSAIRFAVWGLSIPALLWLVRRFPLNQGAWPRQVAKLLLVALLVSPIVSVVQMSLLYWTWFPYRKDVPSLWMALGNGWMNFANELLAGLALIVALQAWRMLEDLRAERTRAIQLERQLAISRLDTLRMQLQPHFLFNSLHTIAGLIGEEPQSARRMVVALGDLLRLTLKDAPRCMRSLGEELAFVDRYMEVLRYRMGDRLAVDYAIEPEITRAEVPSLLLQPLFENAVRHGASRLTGPCTIGFRAWRDEDRLHVSLENDGPVPPNVSSSINGWVNGGAAAQAINHTSGQPDGQPAPASGARRGVGLSNTLARLDMQYAGDFTFTYRDRPAGGAHVEMSWPYRVARPEPDEVQDDDAVRAYAAR